MPKKFLNLSTFPSQLIAVTGDTRFAPGLGKGVSAAVLSDAEGVFAVASTSQLVQRRERL